MISLALATPWPPQHTGIADYAYDLANALSLAKISVVVYTTEDKPTPLDGVKIVTIREEEAPDNLNRFDHIVYQLGNNAGFHSWMLPWLSQFPGIIHLHDMVMHHMAAELTWMQGEEAAYLKLLGKWYGENGLEEGRRSIRENYYLWESEIVTEFPLCEEYVAHAKAVVVHSEFVLNYLRTAVPDVPSFVLPQLYNVHPKPAAANKLQRIAVLGGVDPQKRVEWVIDAVSQVYEDQNVAHASLQVDIAGNINPRCENVRLLASEACIGGLEITVHGRVTSSEFRQIFESTDLCIALRFPTMGETSAIVMRALQYGVPTIVNDLGWYAELPSDIVKKIPVENCADQLAIFLARMINRPQDFSEWSSACLQTAHELFDFTGYGDRYIDLCTNYGGDETLLNELAFALYECGFSGSDSESVLLNEILEPLAYLPQCCTNTIPN